jgi:plastocyanin
MDTSSPASSQKASRFWLIGAVLAIGIIVCAIAIYNLNRNPSVVINGEVADVTISADGITPQTIQVSKGQQVKITNNDTAAHRLTADQTALPGFDSTEALNTGDSYTYTFQKSGTYHYYDAADSTKFVGTVEVK